ncbi:hypothetical protein IHQ71_00315 [Rhizobium sp. TH2]|uniref:hypothetical protein n=1 Tax=Rhizobium sp. TH2 TaxID=2775403 RepID=UPI00215775F3|nr:hypothetical protein [Rhizobium sp. TH2]UVC09119.1 hypothetical protein IHQ71_00315 [Rhizobium sp. TH2]
MEPDLDFLGFKVERSDDTNDHEIRLLVNERDVLNGHLGLDPPDFFGQSELLKGGLARIGRCGCGTVGCDDVCVQVTIEDAIVWRGNNETFKFLPKSYFAWLYEAANDRTWEDINRRTERLVSDVFEDISIQTGESFRWASARIEAGKIHLSFDNGTGRQVLLEFPWRGNDPSEAVKSARILLNEIASA